jgi:pimeloyl-ACP methyl ester carboxylesterase
MTAPLLVLVHGAWAGGWVWDPVLPALRGRGYRVVAVELPGWREPEERSTVEQNVRVVADAVGTRAPCSSSATRAAGSR